MITQLKYIIILSIVLFVMCTITFHSWIDYIKQLGGFIDCGNSHVFDCDVQKSMFIDYVNKLCSNYGPLYVVHFCYFSTFFYVL